MAGLLTVPRRVRSTDRDVPCLVLMRWKRQRSRVLAPGTLPFLLWRTEDAGGVTFLLCAVPGGRQKGLPMVDAGVLRGPVAEVWGSPQCVLCVPKNGSG